MIVMIFIITMMILMTNLTKNSNRKLKVSSTFYMKIKKLILFQYG